MTPAPGGRHEVGAGVADAVVVARRRRQARIFFLLASAPLVISLVAAIATAMLPARESPFGSPDIIDDLELRGDPTTPQFYGDLPELSDLFQPPHILRDMAASWVSVVNEHNPTAIIHHEVDEHGTLYLVAGAWLYVHPNLDIPTIVEGLAFSWHAYLYDVTGPWWTTDGLDDGFEPGVVLFDCQGELARNVDRVTQQHRPLAIASCIR
jgi:hypothetical protein